MNEDLEFMLLDAEERMKGAISALEGDFATFRTGRASPSLLDRIVVEVYGTDVVLNQMASIGVPEPQQLLIKPYDANTISAIERAILKSDLGMVPNSDGKVVRLNLPPLTEERRRDLTRQVNKRAEDAKVAIRNVRRDIQNDIRKMLKDREISEDESHGAQDQLQELTDNFVKQIDTASSNKETEIMEI